MGEWLANKVPGPLFCLFGASMAPLSVFTSMHAPRLFPGSPGLQLATSFAGFLLAFVLVPLADTLIGPEPRSGSKSSLATTPDAREALNDRFKWAARGYTVLALGSLWFQLSSAHWILPESHPLMFAGYFFTLVFSGGVTLSCAHGTTN